MTAPLDAPRSADDLYLARAAEGGDCPVPVLRPIMTGDVFPSVSIPGVDHVDGDDQGLAIVVSHPCAMRRGPRLNEKLHMVRVVRHPPVRLDEWPKRYFDRMPLPELTVVVDRDDVSAEDVEAELVLRIEEGEHAALFELRGRVETSILKPEQRVACMTEQGVALLHQRLAHHDTRYSAGVEQFIAACDAVFAEVELWEQWNEQLVGSAGELDADQLQSELDRIACSFDEELSKKRPLIGKKNGWYNLRDDLRLLKRHAAARREIYKLLQEKVGALSAAG